MAKQVALLALAAFLCIPLVHFVRDEYAPKHSVDFESAEWKAREAVLTRAKVFVKPG